MDMSSSNSLILVLVLFAFCCEMQMIAGIDYVTCTSLGSPCFGKKRECPYECPLKSPSDPKAKVCYIDCSSPTCQTYCKRKIFIFYLHLPSLNKILLACFVCASNTLQSTTHCSYSIMWFSS